MCTQTQAKGAAEWGQLHVIWLRLENEPSDTCSFWHLHHVNMLQDMDVTFNRNVFSSLVHHLDWRAVNISQLFVWQVYCVVHLWKCCSSEASSCVQSGSLKWPFVQCLALKLWRVKMWLCADVPDWLVYSISNWVQMCYSKTSTAA